MRVCRACKKSEAEIRFYDPTTVAGKAAGSMCQPCWVQKSVDWRRAHKDVWNRQRHQRLLQRQHGITPEQFEKLYAAPKCGGCGVSKSKPQNGSPAKRLALDHCHTTNRIRGLLCHECNRTIATAQDSPQILRQLADYLENPPGI
jgi:protein-arginine kinase activator protein McsA